MLQYLSQLEVRLNQFNSANVYVTVFKPAQLVVRLNQFNSENVYVTVFKPAGGQIKSV